MTLTATRTFEEGSNGAAVASAVNGVIATSGTVVYDSSAAMHGSMGINVGSSSAIGYDAPGSGQVSVYWKSFTQPATSTSVLVSLRATSSNQFRIRLNSSTNKFELTNAANAVLATSTLTYDPAVAGRADLRWEYNSGNLTVTCRLYIGANANGNTPDETMGPVVGAVTVPNRVYIGTTSASWGLKVDTIRHYDDITTWPTGYSVPSSPAATLVYAMSGGARATTTRVVAKVADGTSVRLAYSTNSAMTSPSYAAAVVPNSDGYCTWNLTGLTANTKYYYQLRNTPSGGTEVATGGINSFRTRPSSTGTAPLKIALGSCADTATTGATDAFTDIAAWDPHVFLHLGDAYYNGSASTTTIAQHRAKWEDQINALAKWKTALASVGIEYTNSDHELNPDNTDSNTTNAALFNQFFVETIPSIPLVMTGSNPVSKHRSWVDSSIRFIMLDTRNTARSPGLNVDGASKTMLGATQLAWLLAELSQPELLKVIISDVPWSHEAAVDTAGMDKWWAYAYERQVIANHITSNNINVDFLHGDAHRVAVDATHNQWGNFPVICGSPLAQNSGGSETNGWWDAYWPLSGTGQPHTSAYMRLTYEWLDANTIQRTASGWDAVSQAERVSLVSTWTVPSGSGGTVRVKTSTGNVAAPVYYKNSSGVAVQVSGVTVKA